MRAKPVVAIDGPSGVGKSTVAKGLARQLGYSYIDTGALYRSAAWLADESGVDWQDGAGVAQLLIDREFEFDSDGAVLVDGRALGNLIRTPHMSRGASAVAKHAEVREVLVRIQRQLGSMGAVVLEGRDIGTVVFPDAEVKFFLTASERVRAERRFGELQAKGEHVSVEEVERDQARRDEADMTRAVSPLKKARDAVEISTEGLGPEEVVLVMMNIVKSKFPLTFGQKA